MKSTNRYRLTHCPSIENRETRFCNCSFIQNTYLVGYWTVAQDVMVLACVARLLAGEEGGALAMQAIMASNCSSRSTNTQGL